MTKKNKCHPDLPAYCKEMCKSCYNRQYRSANKEKIEMQIESWLKTNKQSVNEKKKAWALNNPDKIKETKRLYVQRNLLQYRAMCAKRHAAKIQRTPKWADIKAIKNFYLNCPIGMEVDHVIPMQGENVSGLHVLENLQYLTRNENREKHNKFSLGK
jgi:hypothetical protein